MLINRCKRWLWIAVGSLAVLLVVGVAIVSYCEPNYQAAYDCYKKELSAHCACVGLSRFISNNVDLFLGFIDVAAAVVVAWFTIVLSKSTRKLGKTSRVQAALAGRQADYAEKLAAIERLQHLATHRPRILVHTCEVARISAHVIGAQFLIVNAGANRAKLTRIATSMFLAIEPKVGASMDAIELTQELKGGERIEWCAAPDTLSAVIATVHNRSPGDPKLWLVGKITYIDGLDCERETGFCRVYDPVDEMWKRVDNSDYDYDY